MTPEYVDYDYSEYPTQDNDVYNEIDVDTRTGVTYETPYVESNHIGHVVALTLSFVLIILVIFGLIAYFYWAQDAFKDFIRKQKLKWMMTTPPTITVPSGKLGSLSTISFPGKGTAATPPVPPRRSRHSGEPQVPPIPQRQIRTISPPTNVSINGVKVCPSQRTCGEASLHVPDD